MSDKLKEYLISVAISFIAAFSVAVLPFIDGLSLEAVKEGALIGVIFAGARSGVKAVLEYIVFVTTTK